jgi:hypothetical protein
MTNIVDQITHDVKILMELEREFLQYTYETKKPSSEEEYKQYFENILTLSERAFDLRYKIQKNSQEIDIIKIYNIEIRDLLDKIRKDSDNLYSINLRRNISDIINKDLDENKRIPIDLHGKLLSDDDNLSDFHSNIDFIAYFIRRIRVGPIITTSILSDNIKRFFYEVRQAYAFGLYRSSVVMCRSLLEMTIFNQLKKKKLLDDFNIKVIDYKQYFGDKLIDMLKTAKNKGLINYKIYNLSHEIRKNGNKIIHLKDDNTKIDENEALKIIKDTIQVIEYMLKK